MINLGDELIAKEYDAIRGVPLVVHDHGLHQRPEFQLVGKLSDLTLQELDGGLLAVAILLKGWESGKFLLRFFDLLSDGAQVVVIAILVLYHRDVFLRVGAILQETATIVVEVHLMRQILSHITIVFVHWRAFEN